MEKQHTKNEWNEIGGYDQKVTIIDGEIKEITCTCMWTTMEMSRFKEYKHRRPCKHIKEIINGEKYKS